MKKFMRFLSYVLVAAVASGITFFLCGRSAAPGSSKLDQLESLIMERFIDGADATAIEDAAAEAMIDALGDRWSYYIPAADYQAHVEQMANAYVGIGITISTQEEDGGFTVLKVASGGPAEEAGILPGDVVVAVDGRRVSEIGVDAAKDQIRGEEGTPVALTVSREGKELSLSVTRRNIQTEVATAKMLAGQIGLVTIVNFDERCADETLAAIGTLLEQGAKALIFDVRNNPGGYKTELVEVLDYLLPEGPLFRSQSYTGAESVDTSDANYLDIPMAVLVNGGSYSAAEFFAAALQEYDAAVVVGEHTSGKGHYQNTFQLSDGSAVGLSVGKYATPNDVCLEGVGIDPDIPVAVTEEQAAAIYSATLAPEDDPQIQAAITALAP